MEGGLCDADDRSRAIEGLVKVGTQAGTLFIAQPYIAVDDDGRGSEGSACRTLSKQGSSRL